MNNENPVLKGHYKFTTAFLETPEQFKLSDLIGELREKGEKYLHLVEKLNKICKTRILEFDNIIPDVGRTLIADNFTNPSPDNAMLVDYIALGDTNTGVANGDTTLANEVYRNSVASRTNANNIAYVSGFFNATEIVDTLHEAGIFSDADDIVDDGILVSRVLLNQPTGIVKSNTETLTIDWTITIS